MTQMSQLEIADDLVLALQEAQKGDQSAWEALFKECYPKVRRVVRRRLNRSMRSLVRLDRFRQRRDGKPGGQSRSTRIPVGQFADRLSGAGRRAEGDRRVSAAAHTQA